jgi:hypothetical protein
MHFLVRPMPAVFLKPAEILGQLAKRLTFQHWVDYTEARKRLELEQAGTETPYDEPKFKPAA